MPWFIARYARDARAARYLLSRDFCESTSDESSASGVSEGAFSFGHALSNFRDKIHGESGIRRELEIGWPIDR